jgi:hypothetical protein
MYGLDEGLARYNQTISKRSDERIAATVKGQLDVTKEKGVQDIKKIHALPSFAAAGAPAKLKNGNLGVTWFDKRTGKSGVSDSGVPFDPTQTGAKAANSKMLDAVANIGAYESQLEEYEKLLNQVDTGRIGGSVEKLKASVGMQDAARAASGQQEALASSGARVINGERGMLTNQDVERAKLMIPLITDTASERVLKFKLLKTLLAKRKAAITSGYDGSIHTQELNDPKWAPVYTDLNWDADDSKTYLQQFKHWPSYEEAMNALSEGEN